eukprot:9492977-Pyramimonas_sp.AAC.1
MRSSCSREGRPNPFSQLGRAEWSEQATESPGSVTLSHCHRTHLSRHSEGAGTATGMIQESPLRLGDQG